MNTIVVTSTKQNIKFGYEGEDNVTKIIFPYDESWLEYGEGNFEVRILRCGDEVAYTATDIVDDRQAMTLTMTVTDIELSVRGRGEMQLCYVCPDSIKKSPIYQYTVNRSVDYKYAVDPPEGSIIASVEKSLSEIKNTTNRLSNSVISIESSIDDVNSQIDNINDKISEFDEEIDSIGEVETRVDNLETSIQSINGRINTAEGNINENTESISDLNESVTELENRKVTDLETSGGRSDSGKYLTVGTDGKIKATSLTIPPTITVDASLSTTSTNPVQNKVIKTELNNINSNIETCNTEISKINGSLGTLKADSIPFPTGSDSKYGTNGQLLRTKGNGLTEWASEGLPTDEQTAAAVQAWLDEHPEATTTVQDGSITESKLSSVLLVARLKYKYISGETISLVNGNHVYENCNINDISTETILTGTHIFYNCTIGKLFIGGGEYEFHNCDFDYINIVSSTGRFFACIGTGINLTGACHNSIIDSCKLTASEEHGTLVISGSISNNVKICNNTIINLQSTTLTGVELNCINTHGISNSIIENNYCETDTERVAIDISGNGVTIRSFNNVVRNNTCVIGNLSIYAAKNIKVENNHVPAIYINGEFLEQDYGYLIFTGNIVLSSFNFRTQTGVPTSWNIYIYGNICFSTGIQTYHDFSDNIKIYFVDNTIANGSRAKNSNDYGKKVILPQKQLYVLPGETVKLPPCQIIKSEFSEYPAETISETWTTITNTSQYDRYIVYSELRSGTTSGLIWSQ